MCQFHRTFVILIVPFVFARQQKLYQNKCSSYITQTANGRNNQNKNINQQIKTVEQAGECSKKEPE